VPNGALGLEWRRTYLTENAQKLKEVIASGSAYLSNHTRLCALINPFWAIILETEKCKYGVLIFS
jgi:hypothetical protein